MTVKAGEVITRIPRGDVVSAEVGRGAAPQLTMTLANGEIWQFEISNPGILALVSGLEQPEAWLASRRSAEPYWGRGLTRCLHLV
ncbi:MAG: hypothetical protein ACLP0J_18020 [Solirubrobacteraceae bacterium]